MDSPSDGSSPPVPMAPAVACRRPRWSPESTSLLFLSDGQLRRVRMNGAQGSAVQILTPLAGRDHGPLAAGRRQDRRRPGTGRGERGAGRGGGSIVWGDSPCARLRLLDLGTRELRTVDGLGDRHVVEVSQRPDGGPLAIVSWAHPDTDPGIFTAELHLVDPVGGAVRGLGRLELQAGSLTWWHAHDSWHLAYLAVTPPGPVGGMAVLDIAIPRPALQRSTAI